MEVEITAHQRVKLSQLVEMSESDYKEYEKILDSYRSDISIDKKVNELADKYDFNSGFNQVDWEDPEDTMFCIFKVEVVE
jgi:two-component SAPR family response regulator